MHSYVSARKAMCIFHNSCTNQLKKQMVFRLVLTTKVGLDWFWMKKFSETMAETFNIKTSNEVLIAYLLPTVRHPSEHFIYPKKTLEIDYLAS